MINNLELFLPREFINKAISLKDFGINEYAWDYDFVMKIIDYLCDRKIVILGGDIYSLSNGVLKSAYANWYFNFDIRNTIEHNVNRSKETAIKYINNYNNKLNNYYSLVAKKYKY